jgi:hypothetical protein
VLQDVARVCVAPRSGRRGGGGAAGITGVGEVVSASGVGPDVCAGTVASPSTSAPTNLPGWVASTYRSSSRTDAWLATAHCQWDTDRVAVARRSGKDDWTDAIAGVPPTPGGGVGRALRRCAAAGSTKCLDGQQHAVRKRVEEALRG